MKTTAALILLLMMMFSQAAYSQKPQESLNEHLEALRPMLGKTFRGAFAISTPDKPMIDVSKWERAMNGQAIRTLHSVNDGEYGGESIMMWDPAKNKISYWYFTTAGFHTQGTIDIEGNKWISVEEVSGNANGISKVKAVSELLPNGDLHVKSWYLSKDEWVPGHEITYKMTNDATVNFK